MILCMHHWKLVCMTEHMLPVASVHAMKSEHSELYIFTKKLLDFEHSPQCQHRSLW